MDVFVRTSTLKNAERCVKNAIDNAIENYINKKITKAECVLIIDDSIKDLEAIRREIDEL